MVTARSSTGKRNTVKSNRTAQSKNSKGTTKLKTTVIENQSWGRRMNIMDVLTKEQMRSEMQTEVLFEGELSKYSPGISVQYIPRWCQVTRRQFMYFNSQWSANCWLRNPLAAVPLEAVRSVQRVVVEVESGRKRKKEVKKVLYQFEIFLKSGSTVLPYKASRSQDLSSPIKEAKSASNQDATELRSNNEAEDTSNNGHSAAAQNIQLSKLMTPHVKGIREQEIIESANSETSHHGSPAKECDNEQLIAGELYLNEEEIEAKDENLKDDQIYHASVSQHSKEDIKRDSDLDRESPIEKPVLREDEEVQVDLIGSKEVMQENEDTRKDNLTSVIEIVTPRDQLYSPDFNNVQDSYEKTLNRKCSHEINKSGEVHSRKSVCWREIKFSNEQEKDEYERFEGENAELFKSMKYKEETDQASNATSNIASNSRQVHVDRKGNRVAGSKGETSVCRRVGRERLKVGLRPQLAASTPSTPIAVLTPYYILLRCSSCCC
eukprot:TRINITY_DN9681_c0_g9_i1.p1 TRINITY_DN9681_c0_g9~~TRINITY_DN9681_c0_g9_i1.p1  ORF type:complete len:492 (+),score=73.02 TRINITY_DN9681_c0_g9_i1:502-1977(+)